MGTIRLSEFVNERRLNWFDLNVLIWTFLALFADGYDITVVAFAAPEMTHQWHISAGALGPVMSASMVGFFLVRQFLESSVIGGDDGPELRRAVSFLG